MKILHKLLMGISLLCMMILPLKVQGQMSCGNEGIHEHMMNTSSKYKKRFLHLMDDIQKTKDNPEYRANARASYVIPIVVHWVYNGDGDPLKNFDSEKIKDAILYLNESYKNTGIEFCFAERDPQGNSTNGVVRWDGKTLNHLRGSYNGIVEANDEKLQSNKCKGITSRRVKENFLWPEKNYFNIWVVETFCDEEMGGFGTFPWQTGVINGVMLRRDLLVNFNNKSRLAIPHEAGHYLGLFHTFHDEARNGKDADSFDCPIDIDNETQGDLISDTPPHRLMDKCSPQKPCGGIGDWKNSRYNYMNYCLEFKEGELLFTPKQIDRMRDWLNTIASPRWSLLNSLGCTPPVQNLPDLTISNQSASPTTVDPGANVTVSFRVNNIGNAAAPANYTSIHLSSNNILTPGQNGDLYLDEYYHSQTIATGSSTGILSKSVRIPASTAPGTYYIFISADGAETIRESNENNNQAYAQITVRGSTASCTPSVPSGLSQTSSQTSVILGWASVSGAQKYEVRFNNSTYSTSGTSINIPGLNCGTSYSWQVRSVCPNGNTSSYSSSRTVSTSSCGSTTQNDDCGNAALIVSNGSCLTGTVRGATGSYGPNLCGGCSCISPDDKDVYYKFVAQSTSHTVTVSDYASNFDAVIELRTACQSGTSNYLGCYDPVGVPSSVSYTWYSLVVGRTYYIRVYEYNYTGTPPSRDDFKICVTHTPQATDCDVFNYFPEVYYGRARGGSNSDESLVIHTTQYGCNYRVTKGSGCDFVSINNPTGTTDRVGNPPYIGQKEIFYTLDRNSTNSQRTCVLTVNGKRHTIIQNGCDPYFYPEAKSIKSAGETYTLEVDDESFCSWNFSQSNCSWVSFSQTSGSGSRDITVKVSPNTSSSPRTCRITLNNGETHVINQQGMVCNPPTGVNIIASSGNNTICENETVRLTAQTDCNDCTYTWSNGGKSSSVTVANQGRYTVTVANACGSKSAEITLTRASLPVQPGNINGNSIVCSGTSQSYSVAAVSGATSYEWTYTGSGYIYSMNNSITFNPESSGVLSVTANNDCGSSAERTLAITVNPLPARPEAITASTDNVCSGTAITYSIPAVSGATSYTWTYSGGGNPSGKNNSISFKPTSSGTLSVVANNACGVSVERTLAVTINSLPVISAEISGNAAVCSGISQTYSVPAVSGATFEWTYSGGGNLSGTGRSITFTPTSNGTLKVIAKNACGNSTAKTLAITVSTATVATPGNINGNSTVCSGTSQSYSVAAVSGATSYEWTYSGGGNPSGTGRTVTLSPTSSGTLSVKAKNGCGISTAKTLAITVNPLPARPAAITASTNNVCSGTAITYSIPAVSGATSYTWTYSGGGNPSGKNNSISFKPTSSGTLSVVANNACGAGTARTFAVTVNTVPDKPAISANGATDLCADQSVQLTTGQTGVSYQWRKNGSNISGATQRNYTVTTAGTYTLVTSNNCGNSSASNAITVNSLKTPARPGAITASKTNICSGETINFSVSTVSGATSYTWTYSGGGNPSGKGNSISFKPTSDGTLTVVAENACGVSTSRTLALKVSAIPTRPGAISGKSSVCSGATETYQVAAVAGAEKYTWSYSGGGNPVGTGRSITLKPSSNGTLTVIAENFCGKSTSRTFAITVNPLPARPEAISGKTAVCSGDVISYQVPVATGADSYVWTYSGGGNPSGTGRSITLKPTSSGTLTVTAKNICGNSASRTLQINVTPQPARPSLIQGSATICKGINQTYFVDADNNVKDYTWSYTGEGTVSGTGRSITFKPNTSGTLSVTGSNTCGTSTARTMKITVKDGTPTSQPGLIKGETSYCSGETKTYSIDPVGGAKGYLWTYSGVGNPVGDGTSISLTPVSAGTLRVVALSECGGGVARTLTLSVKALPKPPVIVRNGDILTSNYNTGNQWYYNGKPLSGATEKTLTVDKKGVYSVEYTNSNGCTSISDEYQVLSTSIDEKEVGIEAFTIYPNPNDGYFTVEIISTREKDARIDIVNILGQVISSEQLHNLYGKNTIRKDLSKYGKGLYLINLYLDEGVVTRRVVIE